MFKICKSGLANSLMHAEAVAGRFGIRCFDYFGAGEDAIAVYPSWDRVEQFLDNNKNHPELFEVLTGTEFDLGIEDAVLVAFDNDDRAIICSRSAAEKRSREIELERKVADGWKELERQQQEISESLNRLNEEKENFRKNHAARMQELDEALKSMKQSVYGSSDAEEPEINHGLNSEDWAVMKKLKDISSELDALLEDE